MHSFITANFLPPKNALIINPDPSIGIDAVRQIQSFLSRKPVDSSQNIVVIESAHLLTLAAQHALLKTLEEPPANALIYLVTRYPDMLLPTILSRVQTISSPPPTLIPINPLIPQLLSARVGDRLQLLSAQNFTRQSLSQFLDNLEVYLHNHLDSKLDYQLIVDTRKYLNSNCNLKLILTHLALHLQS